MNPGEAAYKKAVRAAAARLKQGEPVDLDFEGPARRHINNEARRESKRRERRAARPAEPPKPRARRAADKPAAGFVALDGEGLNRRDGSQDYVLLGCSDGSYIESYDKGGLTTRQCFDFLLGVADAHPGARLVGFAFGYDSNMMFRDLSDDALERLALGEYATYRAIGATFRIRYIPGKSLYLSRGVWGAKGWQTHASARVWDVFGFFQSRFVAALDGWQIGDAETRARIDSMKNRRNVFTRRERERIRAYCLDECRLLVNLMDKLAAVLDAADMTPTRWDGAGAVAGALMQSRGVKAAIVRPDDPKLIEAQLSAYFGGRVERFVAGRIDGPVYGYDINSAYPAQIAELPSLHGRWRKVRTYDPRARWALWRVAWNTRGRAPNPERPGLWALAPFPFRDHRHILWPNKGAGWYHTAEVAAALDSVPGNYTIDAGYIFEPDDESARPFAWARELYDLRRVYKDQGDARNIVIKLGLNSLYGKLAQGVSGGNGPPAYQSYYLAGVVTAGCRAQMLRAAATARPRDLVAIATDGLYVREPLAGLDIGPALGAWESSQIEPGLLVVQSGVALTPDRSYIKTRGASKAIVGDLYGPLLDAWRRDGFYAAVDTTERRFIGLAYAHHVGHMHKWRRWLDVSRAIRFNPTPRKWPSLRAWGDPGECERVYPPQCDGFSEPYTPKGAQDWAADLDDALTDLQIEREQPDYG